VLNSGNLKVLNDFYKAHEKELRDPKNAPCERVSRRPYRNGEALSGQARKF
jgi:hypothetical protein